MRILRLNHSCRVWFGQASSCNLQGASGGAALGHFSAIKRLGSVSRKAWLTGGAGQTGGATAGHLGRVMPGTCQQPPSSLWPPFLPKHRRTIVTRVPPESPQNTPKGYAAQGLCSRVHTAKNSQTWAWKGRDGGWGAAVLSPSPSGYLGVRR